MKYTIATLAFTFLFLTSCQQKEEKNETGKTTKEVVTEKPSDEELPENQEMCFRQIVSKDTLMLTVLKNGENISGTYKSTPYEKDKKTIIFRGSLNGNTVTAVGTAMGEGKTVREEIVFTIENNKAGIKFGEMIQGDDGVYRYKNLKSSTPLYINKVDCP
ncbi:MAG: hypothetical protein DI539_21600 [Flavobacterium psychrophilum]|nr:MAG: hypothetical protein DI539_21600 [Flavobacterium psychrophilum]